MRHRGERASTSGDDWARVHRAYVQLIGTADPVGPLVAEFGAVDLRPRTSLREVASIDIPTGPVVVSGANDLIELRTVVERVTGPGSWFAHGEAALEGTPRRGRLDLARPAQAMGLVLALEGFIHDNGGAWRTWRTAVEAIAAGVAELDSLTLEAVVLDLS